MNQQLICFINQRFNQWQLVVAQYGGPMGRAKRHYFNTMSEAVEAAQQLNPVRIVRSGRA